MSRGNETQLRKIPLFESLPDEDLKEISSKVVLKDFRRNAVILGEEDTNEYMYVIISGKAKVYKISEDGKETILAMHAEGESFGEMSLLDGRTAPATVAATENSVIALISKDNFYKLLYGNRKVLDKMLELLCYRARDGWRQIQMLTFKNAAQRLKLLMIKLSEEHGREVDGGVVIDLKLTHQTIADMSGLTRETVTRVLDRWQRDGDVKVLKEKHIFLGPGFFKEDFKL